MAKPTIGQTFRRTAALRGVHIELPQWLVLVFRALAHFWSHNGPGMAATVAFFGFLSLVPLVLLLLAFLANVIGSTVSARDVHHLFQSVVPGLSQQQFLQAYWHPIRHSRVTTTVLGVASLLLGTLGLHDSVDWAVNHLWQSDQKRPFWLMKLRGLAVILWVIVFALFSLWLSWLLAEVSGLVHSPSMVAFGWLALVPSVLVDVAIFAALYSLTPTVRVRAKPAIVAGVVAALLWEISKVAFDWWVLQVGTYNRVYGPLAASVIVMLWVWISAMIFLYGAALAAVIQRSSDPQAAPSTDIR